MENYYFLILVAVVGLIRWIAQAAENKKNNQAQKRGSAPPAPSSTPPPNRGAPGSEEERVRKFLEALGVPTTSSPPPKVQPRQVAPKSVDKKILPVDPFPAPRGRVVEPSRRSPAAVTPPPLPKTSAPLPTRETSVLAQAPRRSALASEFEVQELGAGSAPAKRDAVAGTLLERLATGEGLRDAMVLREIFGPPRSLQSFNPAH